MKNHVQKTPSGNSGLAKDGLTYFLGSFVLSLFNPEMHLFNPEMSAGNPDEFSQLRQVTPPPR